MAEPRQNSSRRARASLRDLHTKSSEEGLEQEFNSLDAQRASLRSLSQVKSTKAGRSCRRSMTMAPIRAHDGSPGVATGCWRIFAPARSMWSLSIRSIG